MSGKCFRNGRQRADKRRRGDGNRSVPSCRQGARLDLKKKTRKYIAKFYAAFAGCRCRPTHLPLFSRTPDLKRALLPQDVIYVGGGNTKSMLAVWQEWGLPQLLRKAWSAGTVLAGFSAGAICWFKTGLTDSWGDRLAALPCL